MPKADAATRVRLLLKKATSSKDSAEYDGRPYVKFKPHEQFPVPALVLFVLRDVLGLRVDGPWEKTRWSIPFEYEGARFVAELRKLGFTILADPAHPEGSALTKEVLGKLAKAVRIVEGELDAFARNQAVNGAVTLANRFSQFDATYRFLRERAREASEARADAQNEAADPSVPEAAISKLFAEMNERLRQQREGDHLAGAMTNAYFSRVEHSLVLALPFIGFDPSDSKLLDFVSARWSVKIAEFFDLATDGEAKELCARLKRLRDHFRNPLAHGGFETDGGSFFFHLPKIGALPARMTGHRDGPHFSFHPAGGGSFAEACALFDSFDDLFARRHPFAWRWIDAETDVAFDEETRKEYDAGMSSDDHFEQLIERTARDVDHHDNFEY
jgi:hypothetical protein